VIWEIRKAHSKKAIALAVQNKLGQVSAAQQLLANGWSQASITNYPLQGAQSVLVEVLAAPDGAGNLDVHFDHVFFGPSSTPVQLQSFDVN